MKTYTELFTNYKQNISRLAIIKNVPSTRKTRRLSLIMLSGIGILVGIMWWINPKYNILYSCIGAGLGFILIILGDKKNKKDLIKEFTFSDTQKEENTWVLLDVLQAEILRLHIGKWGRNGDYIKNLCEISKEKQIETKKEFNLKEWEGMAIIMLILSNYAGALYTYFNTEEFSFEDISILTAFVIFTLIALSFMYFNVKSLYLSWRNTDYGYHKELYFLLRDLETKARFENYETNVHFTEEGN